MVNDICVFVFAGIYSVNVDYKLQKVTVWGICNKYDVLATIRSKRKEARFWNCDKIDACLPEPVIPSKARPLSWNAWKIIAKAYLRRHN